MRKELGKHANKCAAMVLDSTKSAMMGINIVAMAALNNARKNRTGSAKEVLLTQRINAKKLKYHP